MKELFVEFGRTIIVVVAVIAVFTILFVRLDILGVLGTVADVNSGISHSEGESALNQMVERAKPSADLSGVDLHISANHVFRPLEGVVFKDAAGNEVKTVITSILYCDSEGNTTEFVNHYNAVEDIVVLNPAHYSVAHKECTASEYTVDANDKFVIGDDGDHNCPGVVMVTYMATDTENQSTVERLTFVIDNIPA